GPGGTDAECPRCGPVALAEPKPPDGNVRLRRLGLVLLVMIAANVLAYAFFFAPPRGPRLRPVFATRGKVFYQGQPAAGAEIFLLPEEASEDRYQPYGQVQDDGSVVLSTYYKHDGAPAGRYKVRVLWLVPRGALDAGQSAKLPPEAQAVALAGGTKVDKLGERYADPETSGLRVEIKPGAPDELPTIELK